MPQLNPLSATGPGASVEDRPEAAGDCVPAPDGGHHRGEDLPPVSEHVSAACTRGPSGDWGELCSTLHVRVVFAEL